MGNTEDIARELYVWLFGYTPVRGVSNLFTDIYQHSPNTLLVEDVLDKLDYLVTYHIIDIGELRAMLWRERASRELENGKKKVKIKK